MELQLTRRDPNQILAHEHSETHDAKRVYVVNGLPTSSGNSASEIKTIEIPVIIKEIEIKEIEKPVIIVQEKIQIVEVPKVIYETKEIVKEIVKEIIKEVPIVQTQIQVIEKPIYIYKDTEKLVKIGLALQFLLTIYLMLKK